MNLYTIKEVSEIFKMAEGTVRNWVSKGTIKAVKIGGATRITEEEVNKMITDYEKEVSK